MGFFVFGGFCFDLFVFSFFFSGMVIISLVKFSPQAPPQKHPVKHPRKGWSAVIVSEFATQNHDYETAVQAKL